MSAGCDLDHKLIRHHTSDSSSTLNSRHCLISAAFILVSTGKVCGSVKPLAQVNCIFGSIVSSAVMTIDRALAGRHCATLISHQSVSISTLLTNDSAGFRCLREGLGYASTTGRAQATYVSACFGSSDCVTDAGSDATSDCSGRCCRSTETTGRH